MHDKITALFDTIVVAAVGAALVALIVPIVFIGVVTAPLRGQQEDK